MKTILAVVVLFASYQAFATELAYTAQYMTDNEVTMDETDWNFQQSLLELNGEDARVYLTAGPGDPNFSAHNSRRGMPDYGRGYDAEAARKANEAKVTAEYNRTGSWHPCTGSEFSQTKQPGMVPVGTWYWRNPNVLIQRSTSGALCMKIK